MITRIEIDGFKSFVDFTLDLEPFTVPAGANNSGKSNLLEAIVLLPVIARGDQRPVFGRDRGTGAELLHRADDGAAMQQLSISADVQSAEFPTGHQFKIALSPSDPELAMMLVLNATDDAERARELRGRLIPISLCHSSAAWKLSVQSWHFRQNGSAASMGACPELPHAGRLWLFRTGGQATLISRFARGIGIKRPLIMRGGRRFAPALVSDGALRVLAVPAADHDPDHRGVVFIEELENGLHPQYLGRLCGCLTRATSHGDGRRVVATTRSTVIVGDMLERSERSVVFLDQVAGPSDRTGERRPDHWTRARRVGQRGERGTYLSQAELAQYLSPAGGQWRCCGI